MGNAQDLAPFLLPISSITEKRTFRIVGDPKGPLLNYLTERRKRVKKYCFLITMRERDRDQIFDFKRSEFARVKPEETIDV